MRTFCLLMLMPLSACYCSPATPQPVTLRVVNTTRSPIYVEATQNKLGLTVQRNVGGTLFPFDDLACACRTCANACDFSCECPDAGTPIVRRIEAGEKSERAWDGVVRVAGVSNCTSDNTCLDEVNAPLNEPFTLELCFSTQAPSGVRFDDGGVGQGAVPIVTRTCTTKQFQPQDQEVEISPFTGSACSATSQCKGEGELCLDGACTTGCPANDFPVLGSDWLLNVASPDNMGFFEQTSRPTGKQFQGTGTLTSAVYQSNSLLLAFARPGPVNGEVLTGRVQIKVPPGDGAPLVAGLQVTATVIDDGAAAPARAFVLRETTTGNVLFAADMAQQGEKLLTAADIAPFTVGTGTVALGCTQDVCGRFVQFAAEFSNGTDSVEVSPGHIEALGSGSAKWSFLNVGNGKYDASASTCEVTELRPYVFWKSSIP